MAGASLTVLIAVLLTGCGMLPPQPKREHTTALKPSGDSPLVKIARDSIPHPVSPGSA